MRNHVNMPSDKVKYDVIAKRRTNSTGNGPNDVGFLERHCVRFLHTKSN
jgi:hypothetical protein